MGGKYFADGYLVAAVTGRGYRYIDMAVVVVGLLLAKVVLV